MAQVSPTSGDCLLSDIYLSGMDGISMYASLKQLGLDVPVVFISAFDEPITRDRIEKVQTAAYFRKPFDDRALLDTLSALTTSSQQ